MRRILEFSVLALIFAVAIGAAPACADETAASENAPAVAAPRDPGCAPALDLAAVLDVQGGICPATAPEAAAPELKARPPFLRTCVCSCGFPCTTDADCGPGGNCGPGITCC